MIILDAGEFDIRKIAESGQCFRIKCVEPANGSAPAKWLALAKDRLLEAAASEKELRLDCSNEEYEGFWASYFDAQTDYAAIRAMISAEDAFLTEAAACSRGIRILRQDPWEMLITFIISQRKNIPAITSCVEKLCRNFGSRLERGLYAFPTTEQLAAAPHEALCGCSLGYREPYIEETARRAAAGEIDLNKMELLGDEELLEELMSIKGVGIKVANCVSLFGFHRTAAFPIDVWIRRVIDEVYGGSFDPSVYGSAAGVIQQFMFYYGRSML